MYGNLSTWTSQLEGLSQSLVKVSCVFRELYSVTFTLAACVVAIAAALAFQDAVRRLSPLHRNPTGPTLEACPNIKQHGHLKHHACLPLHLPTITGPYVSGSVSSLWTLWSTLCQTCHQKSVRFENFCWNRYLLFCRTFGGPRSPLILLTF